MTTSQESKLFIFLPETVMTTYCLGCTKEEDIPELLIRFGEMLKNIKHIHSLPVVSKVGEYYMIVARGEE